MIASVVWSKLGLTCIPHSTTKGEKMKAYKIYFTSDILESIEVEASSEKEAKDMFETGVLDLSDAKEEAQENLKLDTVKEIKD
jgi:hypothetical protein